MLPSDVLVDPNLPSSRAQDGDTSRKLYEFLPFPFGPKSIFNRMNFSTRVFAHVGQITSLARIFSEWRRRVSTVGQSVRPSFGRFAQLLRGVVQ